MMPLHYMRHVQIEHLCRASLQVATKLVLKGTWADTESTFKATRHARQTATHLKRPDMHVRLQLAL